VFAFFATAIVTAGILVAIAFQYIDSPKAILLEQQNADLKNDYVLVQQQLNQLQQKMDELLKRDNNVYRSIFESSPIPDSARLKEIGNEQRSSIGKQFEQQRTAEKHYGTS
jgi:formiminotetrahydrofolate cyclodeaminase